MSEARDAQVTVVGGGTIGCAVAYHLARAGFSDVQLLERAELCGATSSQAAGLVGQVRMSVDRTRLAMRSVEAFASLEEETGVSPDWRQTGSIRLAMEPARVAELEEMAAIAGRAGLEVEQLSMSRLGELMPMINTAAVSSALWCPSDGYLQPNSLTSAYIQGARSRGVTFATHTEVVSVTVRAGEVVGISTDRGDFTTEMVIDAAGPWAGVVASMVGVSLPIVPVRHQYYVTEAVPGWRPDLPVLRVPDARIYARAEMSGVLCGGWEARASSIDPRDVNRESALSAEPDFEVLSGFAGALANVAPTTGDAGVRAVFRGYPTFSPDGRFIVGPIPGLRGFVMAAACNAHGVSGSAGLAAHVVESLSVDVSPYVRSLSPARFLTSGWEMEQMRKRAQAVYENYYTIGAAAQGAPVTPLEEE
ncbi:MAG: NAD(P)/FAD-dependent oxidoreductase [Ferrimicrobium sp.]|uniref:FAD-dependent oxidoreductase n=1 Tax=Ferrimicrobium acidiphilum TaxID=121039 RepID=A0ABV3Y534_9ACTN|nr:MULTISPECIES: FAD-dependent oxidoreductase [Ferrimicrobium]MCL5973590.1 FAD-binding oxidoreductase [Actinomycetota bacterium]